MNYHQEQLFIDSDQSNLSGQNKCPPSKLYSVRVLVAFLSLLGTAIMYITRVNLNIAILAMVSNSLPGTEVQSLIEVPVSQTSNSSSHGANQTNQVISSDQIALLPPGEFDWSPPVQGIILGSFFYGYTATQIIGGRVSESYSSTKLIFYGLCTSGIINLATPFLARASLVIFVISRILLGAAQGLVYPAFYSLFARWIPANERSTFIPWLDGGITIGTILISASSGKIIMFFSSVGGWDMVFYFSGVLALLWCVLWVILVRSDPEEHPFICKEERDLIVGSRYEEGELNSADPNWRNILTSTVFYAVLAPKICYGVAFDFVTLKIPAYLQDVIHLPVDQNGYAISVIMLGYAVSLLTAGILADSFIVHSSLGKNRVRKLFQLISGSIMAATLLLMPSVGGIRWANVLLLTGCMFGYGFTSGGDVPIVADLGGPLTGTVFAIMNTLCSISGFAVPYIVGVVIESAPNSLILWSSLINGCGLLVLFGTAFFLLFASTNFQTSWVKEPIRYNNLEDKLSSLTIGTKPTESNYNTFSISSLK